MSDDRNQDLLKNRSFWVRAGSGAILVIVLVTVFIVGYDVMLWFLCALSLIGMFELYRGLKLGWSVFSITGFLTIVAHYFFLRYFNDRVIFIILIYSISMIVILAGFVFSFPRYSMEQVFGSYFGIFYVGVTLSFLYLLRIHPPSGAYLVWLVVICSWGCDTFAYLFGMVLGRHPLVPKLSPKKSIEGSVGGILGASILAVIYGLAVQRFIPDIKYAPVIFGVIVFVGSFVSQIGDLAASAIKRKIGIKDYGNLIPGHGGVLDRFDSMIIVAPIMYIVTIYTMMV